MEMGWLKGREPLTGQQRECPQGALRRCVPAVRLEDGVGKGFANGPLLGLLLISDRNSIQTRFKKSNFKRYSRYFSQKKVRGRTWSGLTCQNVDTQRISLKGISLSPPCFLICRLHPQARSPIMLTQWLPWFTSSHLSNPSGSRGSLCQKSQQNPRTEFHWTSACVLSHYLTQ